MKVRIEKRKNSQTYYIDLNRADVAQVVMVVEDLRNQKCSSYFVIKEFNTKHKNSEEIQLYQSKMLSIFEEIKALQKKIEKTSYLELAEEEFIKYL